MRRLGTIAALCLAAVITAAGIYTAGAQDISHPVQQALQSIYKIPSVTGAESTMADKIASMLHGRSEKDRLGSVIFTTGSGGRHLVFAAGMDEVGFIISGIQADGMLNMDRVVPAPRPLFDFNQFGHPLLIWTQKGRLEGVLALPSLHTASREFRRDPVSHLTLERALIDIGADTGAEARERGVSMLDPVTPWHDISVLAGDKRAGYALGDKTAAAVLLAAAGKKGGSSSKLSFIWMAQAKFPFRRVRPAGSLGAVSTARNFEADLYVIIGTIPAESTEPGIQQGKGPVIVAGGEESAQWKEEVENAAGRIFTALQHTEEYQSPILNSFAHEGKRTVGLFLPVLFRGTSSEAVDFQDVKALFRLVLELAGLGEE